MMFTRCRTSPRRMMGVKFPDFFQVHVFASINGLLFYGLRFRKTIINRSIRFLSLSTG